MLSAMQTAEEEEVYMLRPVPKLPAASITKSPNVSCTQFRTRTLIQTASTAVLRQTQ